MIEIKDLKKSYGERTVINGLSLRIKKGEKVALMAPSGCGKTTLLRLISGLERAEGGQIDSEASVCFLFQEPRLFPQFTVLQNVKAVLRGKDKQKKALAALKEVGLEGEEGKYPHELSGGMAQRAVLARALVTGRQIFLLDEPFKGLDEQAKKELFALCRKALAQKTVLLVTHDEEEARAVCQRLLRFGKGMTLEEDLAL